MGALRPSMARPTLREAPMTTAEGPMRSIDHLPGRETCFAECESALPEVRPTVAARWRRAKWTLVQYAKSVA